MSVFSPIVFTNRKWYMQHCVAISATAKLLYLKSSTTVYTVEWVTTW